ncbi:MAG: heavy metal-binding domain-containing protein [Labilithrix sp.]|nr:heavy metal-binding domain-containing protein [Labilithrix sp.]MCW5818014.1 heavy metal-binding domain-containing protein [Labilithrix sp.]
MTGSPYRSAEPQVQTNVAVTTGTEVPGCRVKQLLGVVRGIALRRERGPDEPPLGPFTAARQAAEYRMIEEAKLLRADAVIGMRYDSNEIEVVAYGTAVRLEEVATPRNGETVTASRTPRTGQGNT